VLQVQVEALEILVVDDQEENLEEMEELLEELGSVVRRARTGPEALAIMAAGNIGLALMDVQMPGMDGFEVARRMRSDPETRFTPIIFISGMRQTNDVLNEGYSAGAVDFMTKPVHPTILLHKARALLKRDHYRRSLLQASHQLELERSFSASILNNTAEGILVVGSEGQIRFANPATTPMLGCSGHELENTQLLDWIETPREDNWQTSIWFEHWQQCRSVDAGSRFGDVRGQASRQGAVSFP
jgi:CheY-like chemotaxis protein